MAKLKNLQVWILSKRAVSQEGNLESVHESLILHVKYTKTSCAKSQQTVDSWVIFWSHTLSFFMY